ncbi:GntR family transcriptional regulator [Actinomadura sp. B10D3]|uniref:GntR family transcriptional regulator n=1 Tax=Actinomadura sp. B10D3 TaxID=3153557 RepID=UPI00325EBA74
MRDERRGGARKPGTTMPTVASAIADAIRGQIRSGELAPGTRLRQNEIAAQFGVSSTPTREAFRLLEAEGLVRITARTGAIVFAPSRADVLETYEIRWALERLAVAQATPKFTPADVREAERFLKEMETAPDYDAYQRAHNSFHLATYQPAAMPQLHSLIAGVRDRFGAYFHMFVTQHAPDEETFAQHRAILDACSEGDVANAENALRLHFEETRKVILAALPEDAE